MTKDEKCSSIRLNELKPILITKASNLDRSLSWLVRKLIREHPEISKQVKDKSK